MKKYKLKFIENSSRNTLMTYSAYGLLYPAMLAFFTLKPPVPAVAKVLTSASYSGMPPASRNTTSNMLITTYIPYSIMALCLALGTSLPTTGPGTSARIICILRSSARGSTAIINTSTPMPPTQLVKLRQNSSP